MKGESLLIFHKSLIEKQNISPDLVSYFLATISQTTTLPMTTTTTSAMTPVSLRWLPDAVPSPLINHFNTDVEMFLVKDVSVIFLGDDTADTGSFGKHSVAIIYSCMS